MPTRIDIAPHRLPARVDDRKMMHAFYHGPTTTRTTPSRHSANGQRPGWPKALLLAGAVLLTAGCIPRVEHYGIQLSEADLNEIQPGDANRREVLEVFGSPTLTTTFGDGDWVYVNQSIEHRALRGPIVLRRDVIVVRFGEDDQVERVDRYDLTNAADIDLIERETPTTGRTLSITEEIIGNIGRFGNAASP